MHGVKKDVELKKPSENKWEEGGVDNEQVEKRGMRKRSVRRRRGLQSCGEGVVVVGGGVVGSVAPTG